MGRTTKKVRVNFDPNGEPDVRWNFMSGHPHAAMGLHLRNGIANGIVDDLPEGFAVACGRIW